MIFLGIDCGTQSLKVVAWNPEDGTCQVTTQSYDLIENLPPGHKEQHPDIWVEALDACLESLRMQNLDMKSVRGIGVSGQQHGLVVLNSSHEVVRPAKLWCDTSTEEQCDRIVEAAGGLGAYVEEIGNALPPGFTASKVLWIRENEPTHYEQIRFMLLPHDFLNFYLTGEMVAEAGDASGTGYFKVRERQWSVAALGWIDPNRNLERCLPRLIQSREPSGRLRRKLAEKWGISSDVTVSSGGGDNMMGAIGSGNVAPGTVTVSLGTSGTLYSYRNSPVTDPLGEITAFCDSTDGWLQMACTMNVTVTTEMIRSCFGVEELDNLDRMIEETSPGAEGLVLLPYLEGERMPNVPHGTGVLLGLRPRTADPPHLARAAMEGTTMGLYYGLERLTELGISASQVRLIGGGSRSRVWRQIVADIFGVSVACLQNREGPAFGAALQAMWCCEKGEIEDLVSSHVQVDEMTRHEPDAKQKSLYCELYLIYKDLSQTLMRSSVFCAHRNFIQRKD